MRNPFLTTVHDYRHDTDYEVLFWQAKKEQERQRKLDVMDSIRTSKKETDDKEEER